MNAVALGKRPAAGSSNSDGQKPTPNDEQKQAFFMSQVAGYENLVTSIAMYHSEKDTRGK